MMRKRHTFTTILIILLCFAMIFTFAACGADNGGGQGNGGGNDPDPEPNPVPPVPDPSPGTDDRTVVKFIDKIDTADMMDWPMQIDSVTLFDDGTLKIVPTEDLLANYENSDMLVDGGLWPFEYIDKVKDVYIYRFGNAGFRTLIALMEDGSLFALNSQALIVDHTLDVYGDIGERYDFADVQQLQDEGAFGVIGVTEGGEEVLLDPYLK